MKITYVVPLLAILTAAPVRPDVHKVGYYTEQGSPKYLLQFARYDGKWMIVNVMWQSPPK